MKRKLIVVLICVVFAGWIGTSIVRDPGYVLIAYGSYRFQTSFWIMLALLIGVIIAWYYLLRLLKLFVGSSANIKGWRSSRKARRADYLARKGLALLAAGEYARAENFLLSSAQDNTDSGTFYLAAAKAADAQKNSEQREAYLRMALEADAGLSNSVAMSAAEMAGERGDWQHCLENLDSLPETDAVLKLKKQALYECCDWHRLLEIMPKLRAEKLAEDHFEKQVVMNRLSETTINDKGRAAVVKRSSPSVRQDPEVVLRHAWSLSDERAVEVSLRNAIKRNWHSEYVAAYGKLGRDTLQARIRHAESWLKKHEVSSELQMALATMYEKTGDLDKAKQACQKSIDVSPSQAALVMMATFLAEDGDYVASNRYLKQALKLRI